MPRRADAGGGAVEGLRKEQVKERATIHMDIETIALNRVGNGTGVFIEHGGGARRETVLEIILNLWPVEGIGGPFLAACHARQKSRGEKFDFIPRRGTLDQLAFEAGTTVIRAVMLSVRGHIAIQGQALDDEFLAISKDQRPSAVGGEPLAHAGTLTAAQIGRA